MTVKNDCWCWMCRRDIPIGPQDQRRFMGLPLTEGNTRMFLCPECGNKRCPRATDHREACTGSNDPDQLGSRYGVWPNPNRRFLDFVEGREPGDV